MLQAACLALPPPPPPMPLRALDSSILLIPAGLRCSLRFADMASTAEQVAAAVCVLYGPPSVAAQAQANAWLTAFQGSAEAWQVPFELLAPGHPGEVQFFGVTVLVRKVRSEWVRLEAGNRQALSQAIR